MPRRRRQRSGAIGLPSIFGSSAAAAVFSPPAVERLSSGVIDEVVVTDTLPLPDDKRFERLTILPIAPLIAKAIHNVFSDDSVTSMFDGAA